MKKILPYILASMFAVSVVAPIGPGAMAHGWCKDRTTTFCEKRKVKKLAREVRQGKAVVVERSADGQAVAVKSPDGTVTVIRKSPLKDGRTAVAVTTPKGTLYGYGGGGRGRGDWGRGGGGRGGGGWGRGPGIGDVAGGIIIGSAVSNWLFPPKPEVVVVEAPPPPPPRPEGPPPWTSEWYDYCNGKYKSFDAKTGYYTGYDGQQHFCS